jgi:hypothetical protein
MSEEIIKDGVEQAPTAGGGLAANVNVHDGAGTAITSTTVGAQQGLDVNIIAGAGVGTKIAEQAEFYGQEVYYDPLVVNSVAKYYLLLRHSLSTDADDDPSAVLDFTSASFASDIVDSVRLDIIFYAPATDIQLIRRMARCMATVEAGANARITTVKFKLWTVNTTTGVFTGATTEKVVTITMDGAALRHVRAILQDLGSVVVPAGDIIALEIKVFGRQVSSSATPSVVTLHHGRGMDEVKIDTEIVTGV